MDIKDVPPCRSEFAAEADFLERKRRKRKKVRLWLGQPKRFDLVKKGMKVHESKKITGESFPSAVPKQSTSFEKCETEEAMAAAILLQMSSHVNPVDANRESDSFSIKSTRGYSKPKGPSWVVDHNYAVKNNKYGRQKQEQKLRKSGSQKPRRTVTTTHVNETLRDTDTLVHIETDEAFDEKYELHKSDDDTQILNNEESMQIVENKIAAVEFGGILPQHLHFTDTNTTNVYCNNGMQILDLSDTKFDETEHPGVISAVFDNIQGDVEYKTVVVAEDCDGLETSYETTSQGFVEKSYFQNEARCDQLCIRCRQQLDLSHELNSIETSPANPALFLESGECVMPNYNLQPRNAPDVIPLTVEDQGIQRSHLSGENHPLVREMNHLSEDLVRNLENANMLQSFMVLFRAIANGHVPDLTIYNDTTSFKSDSSSFSSGIMLNG